MTLPSLSANSVIQETLGGKVALVTGAGSGIGKATAKTLAHADARVAVLERGADALKETAAEIRSAGGEALELLADIGELASLEKAFARLIEEWGRLDIVVANAGINGIRAPAEKIEIEEWDRLFDINVRGTFLTLKLAAPLLKKRGGAIVVVSSVDGNRLFSDLGSLAYSCTKAAQVAMVKMLALEFAPAKVRVNAICPGAISTQIGGSTVKRDLESIDIPVEYPRGSVPLTGGRSGEPAEVARLAWFLVSDLSSHITGTEVYIDGGQSLLKG